MPPPRLQRRSSATPRLGRCRLGSTLAARGLLQDGSGLRLSYLLSITPPEGNSKMGAERRKTKQPLKEKETRAQTGGLPQVPWGKHQRDRPVVSKKAAQGTRGCKKRVRCLVEFKRKAT